MLFFPTGYFCFFCLSIALSLGDHNTICAYNFYTRMSNGDIKYKVAKEEGISYSENNMIKMNTAPNSTEQIVIGIGERLVNEISEKTGIAAEFINFGNDDNLFTVWYIISVDGLSELPELILGGTPFDSIIRTEHYIILAILIGLFIAILLIIYFYLKRKKKR